MKITKEDIENFGTDDEKKQLLERRVEVKKRKRLGRRTNQSKFEEYKEYLRIDVENIETNFAWESWDDLEMELKDALMDLQRVKAFSPNDED